MDVSYSANSQILIFLSTCIFLLYWLWGRNKYWEKRGVPTARSVPLIGNLTFILRTSVTDYFDWLRKKHPHDYVGLYLGTRPALVVQTSELARRVLIKDADQFPDRYIFSSVSADPLGALNLFTVKNPVWSDMRHQLSPMFNTMRLKTVTDLMNKNAAELVRKIQRDHVDNNKPVNLKEIFSMYASDTVAYTVFGLRVSALNDQFSPLWVITNHMVKWSFWRGLEFSLIFFLPHFAKMFGLTFFSKEATDLIKKLFFTTVEERKTNKSENEKDLVNHLLKLRDNTKLPVDADSNLAENLMLAQVAVFILGSIETSSSALSFCLHELANHPEAQEKLYNELNNAVISKGKDVLDYHDLLELKYLSACIYETLRKYPAVAYMDRVCKDTYKLNDEITLEKGTPVFVNVQGLHHDEKVYPEPDEWRPERTLPTSDNDNMNCNFMPFGEGPRFCIGKRYGLMQVRAALAQVMHNYELKPVSNKTKVDFDPYAVILSPLDGCSVKFVPRKRM